FESLTLRRKSLSEMKGFLLLLLYSPPSKEQFSYSTIPFELSERYLQENNISLNSSWPHALFFTFFILLCNNL
ncbi:MAG: hypothetical protein ACN6PI_03420, partial [Sphingobacterium siyangense]